MTGPKTTVVLAAASNYYDPAKYRTYLEQLGIRYPSVRE